MNFYELVRVRDVVPSSVGLPTVGNNLNESAAERRVGNMSDPFAIGFDVQLYFLILPYGALFNIFHVDAGIFHGSRFVAAGDFDRQPGGFIGLPGSFGLSGGLILGRNTKSGGKEKDEEKNSQLGPRRYHVPVDPIFHRKMV